MTRIIVVQDEYGNLALYSENSLDVDIINMAAYDDYSKGDYEEECDILWDEIDAKKLKRSYLGSGGHE